jgi:hypothetical protein
MQFFIQSPRADDATLSIHAHVVVELPWSVASAAMPLSCPWLIAVEVTEDTLRLLQSIVRATND